MNLLYSLNSMEFDKNKQTPFTQWTKPPTHVYNQTCDFCPHLHDFGTLDGMNNTTFDSYNVFGYRSPLDQDQPFKYTYLLNLFTTPNMTTYLAEAAITDDVYALPIHLQRLLMEAKEEVVFGRAQLTQDKTCPALNRLERVRSFCWLRSDADVANLMSSVVELVADDDELEHILMD
ncbi:hypothetical protein BC941DRAFT_413342 [Chlamydoabsidia padenii]|nr:hypothetical protein BC941DRAFT_413342 [Chlamydoabsidia padenii]